MSFFADAYPRQIDVLTHISPFWRTYGSGTLLVMDELASGDTIKDQTEKPSSIIPGVPQTRVFLITTWSSCWIAGSLF